MPHLPDFEAWAIFAKVAERGSFSQAADELGLAKTTVSKAVTRLEERMRTTLLHRTTRRLSLTESGRASLERALRILADGEAVEAEILEEAAIPRGLVRFACTGSFGVRTLAPLLPEFMAQYPEVQIDLHVTDEPVDMIAGGYDLALRIGAIPDSTLRISRLFSYRLPLVASPTYFKTYGKPQHPRELADYPALIYSHIPDSEDWVFQHPEHGEHVVHVAGRIRMNNGVAAIPALVAGLGITLQPEMFVWQELRDGLLEEALPDWRTPPAPVNIITPPGRARPARVRVLLEFLRAHFAKEPWAQGIEV